MKKNILNLLLLFSATACFAQGNWTAVAGSPSSTLGRFDDVSFINDTVGWTGQDGTIYKTIDGGNTWTPTCTFQPGAYIRSIEFINDTLGFVGTLPDAVPAHLYQTSDGGNSFFIIDTAVSAAHDGICGLAHIGNVIIGVGVYAEPAKFIKSSNGGKTWALTDLSAFASGLVECQMLDTNTYLLGGIGMAPDKKAVILKTTDGGLNWVQVGSSLFNTTYTWKIDMLPSGVGYAAVENFGNASFFKTSDFGTSWTEHSIGLAQFFDIGSVGFINDSVGWLGKQHQQGMAKTTNGGLTWSYVNFGVSVNRIIRLNASTLLGSGNKIYKNNFTLSTPPNKETAALNLHEIYVQPNPADKELQVRLILKTNTLAVLDVLDEKGICVEQIWKGALPKGEHQFKLNVSNYPASNYHIYLRSNEGHFEKKFLVLH